MRTDRRTEGNTYNVSNAGGGGFPASVQNGPGAHPAFCKLGTGPFPGGRTDPYLAPRLK